MLRKFLGVREQWKQLLIVAFLAELVTVLLSLWLLPTDAWAVPWIASTAAAMLVICVEIKRSKRLFDHPKEKHDWVARFKLAELLIFLILAGQFVLTADRRGLVHIEPLHKTYAVLAPTICVNRVPSVGFIGPYPEVWYVDFWTITSIGICPDQLPHGFQVENVRVRVDDVSSHNWVEYHDLQVVFVDPVLFNPGTCVDVMLVGREMEFYKQNFSVAYRICRSWRTYADIVQYLQLPHRGFAQLDWERAKSAGLVITNHGEYRGDGTVDALHVRYTDDSRDGPVLLDFLPCLRLEGNIYGFLSSPASRRIRLEVPQDGGQILVKSWDSGETLMTCTAR